MSRRLLSIIVLAMGAAVFTVRAEPGPTAPPVLSGIQTRLQTALDALDSSLAQAALEIGKTGLRGAAAEKVLRELCTASPMATDCSTIDARGRMLLVQPDAYRKCEGADVSGQEQIERLHKSRRPTLSLVFTSVEGVDALDLEQPVLGPEGELTGSVSVLFLPEPFIRSVLSGTTEGCDILVVETSGRILFGTAPGVIGRSILADPAFRSATARKICDEESGHVAGTGEPGRLPREFFWSSVGLHGTLWRVVAVRESHSASGALLDLTYPYDDNSIYWPTADTFKVTRVFRGINDKGHWYASNNYSASEHGGTHADAPIHFAQGGRTMEQIPVDEWIGPAAKIDVTESCDRNRDYQLTVEDILRWEARHGRLPAHAWVIMYTGLDTKWYPDKVKVLGTDLRGPDAIPLLSFPGFSPEAAAFLVKDRDITGIALDTPSIDYGKSSDFQVHRIICGADKLGLENLAGLDRLPEAGAMLYAIPMSIRDGTGAPVRAFAMLPQ